VPRFRVLYPGPCPNSTRIYQRCLHLWAYGPLLGVRLEGVADETEHALELLVVSGRGIRDGAGGLELGLALHTLVDKEGAITSLALIESHPGFIGDSYVISTIIWVPSPEGQMRAWRVHHQYSWRVSPFQANTLALGGPIRHPGGRSVVLGGEHDAQAPPDVGAEIAQNLDEHRSLHVE